MPSRSARDSRYDDPYLFNDPYKSSSPPHNAYEYVGTDDPSGYPEHRHRPHFPVEEPRRRSSPSRRHARTTSPPRHSRRGRDETPPPAYAARSPSPPPRRRSSKRTSPPHRASKDALPSQPKPTVHQKYQEFAQRPGFQRAQTIGKKGLGFLGEAAAAYYATQSPDNNEDKRTRSMGRDAAPSDRDPDRARRHRLRREDSYYDSDGPPQRSHHHRRRHSPSPSPPPPRRRRSERQSRRRDPSESPSVSSRDYSRSRNRDRGRSHRGDERPRRRRAYSYSPSPPPRGDRSRPKSAGAGAATRRDKAKSDEANARWQLAIRSALEAGGLAALRMRKQPGSWTGDKGAKVAKAALGAAAMDTLIENDPRMEKRSGVKGMAESAITGFLASKMAGKSTGGGSGRSKHRHH